MSMGAQLLWIETILKFTAGICFLAAPITIARIFGLQVTATGFWMRILGAALLGMAAGTYIEGAMRDARGLGLAGVLAINLATALTLLGMLIGGRAAPKARGRTTLWFLFSLLTLLSLIEAIHLSAR